MNDSSQPRPGDEDLVQWALDPASRTPEVQRALESDAELAASLAEWESTLQGLRGAFERETRASETSGALAESILNRTTREDLSWRGDLHLITGFVRRRLTSGSVWTKLVAASLIVHLTALPILGFMLLTETPERHFNLFLEKPVDPPFEENLPEPTREVDSLEPTPADRLPDESPDESLGEPLGEPLEERED